MIILSRSNSYLFSRYIWNIRSIAATAKYLLFISDWSNLTEIISLRLCANFAATAAAIPDATTDATARIEYLNAWFFFSQCLWINNYFSPLFRSISDCYSIVNKKMILIKYIDLLMRAKLSFSSNSL